MKKLMVMVSMLALTTSLKAKIVMSVSVDCTEIPDDLAFIEVGNERTSAYHKSLGDLTEEDRASAPPAHPLKWEAFIEWVSAELSEVAPDSPEASDFKKYCDNLRATEPIAKAWMIADDVRYFRTRSIFKQHRMMLEVGIKWSPQTERLWSVARQVLVQKHKCVIKAGIAPKSNIERRIERELVRIRAWR
jgi:hypothetical protein